MDLTLEVPEEQRRTKVWRHPDRQMIEALLRRGRTGDWISKWLESKYPVEDEFGAPLDNAEENERRQLSPKLLETYRAKWLPEARPGVDVIVPELEDMIGRRIGVAQDMGPAYEMEVLETAIVVAQQSLGMAIAQSKDLEMLAGITLEAQKGLLDAVRTRVEVAQKLGIKGYEAQPERHVIQQEVTQTTRNLNVEVQANIDPRTGQIKPNEPEKVSALKQLLAMPPAEAQRIMEAAERVAADEATVESTAEEVSDAE